MEFVKTNGVVIINSGVPASAAPVLVRDEDGNGVAYFGMDRHGNLTDFAFEGNTVCDDGNIGILIDYNLDDTVKQEVAEHIIALEKYVDQAKAEAAKIEADKEAVQLLIDTMFGTSSEA